MGWFVGNVSLFCRIFSCWSAACGSFFTSPYRVVLCGLPASDSTDITRGCQFHHCCCPTYRNSGLQRQWRPLLLCTALVSFVVSLPDSQPHGMPVLHCRLMVSGEREKIRRASMHEKRALLFVCPVLWHRLFPSPCMLTQNQMGHDTPQSLPGYCGRFSFLRIWFYFADWQSHGIAWFTIVCAVPASLFSSR